MKAYETPNLLNYSGVAITDDTSPALAGFEAVNLIQNISIRSAGNDLKPY